MTVTQNTGSATGDGNLSAVPADFVTLTIDGFEIAVPKGTLVIRAAELLGIQIPRFCDHPLLDPVGACRQCLVDVEGQRKPLASCTTTVTDGMVVRTQLSSDVAEKAQRGIMEFLLVNHPLDCPMCDKGGECPLQNQAMSNGQAESRFRDRKRTYPKPIAISSQVLLDRERCVLCARCTRFSQQVAGDPFIELFERGALEQVAVYEDEPFESYFSGNTVQICPVGALTGAAYRFRSRPFDLVSTPSVCEHCASGCAQRTDWRRGRVTRRLSGDDPAVNEEWNCDKGRWAFTYATQPDRITTPLIRENGELRPASWPEALDVAALGLRNARDSGRGVGVLPGGRVTVEDAYAYAKFTRMVLGSNDIDMRARPHSEEERSFLAARVAGRRMTVTYDALEAAPAVLLAGFEPEEESPIVFLRLRKAARKHGLQLFALAPYTSGAVRKTSGTLLRAAPGTEPEYLAALVGGRATDGLDAEGRAAAAALRTPGAVILVGERLAEIPGALSAAAGLADATGAALAWVPRRAGERGAIEAGCLPDLLPGGRPIDDAAARRAVEALWGGELPRGRGRSGDEILAAARAGELGALVVGGVEPGDLADPAAALAALAEASFVVSLELRHSQVTERADIVFPVAPVVEKGGTFLDWEGRPRPFEETLRNTGALSDFRVLDRIADVMGFPLDLRSAADARREIDLLLGYAGPFAALSVTEPSPVPRPSAGQAVLATWRHLLDLGRLQDGEPHLAGTARRSVALLSAATAAQTRVAPGDLLAVSTERGSITLPVALADLPDRVVWLPGNSPGSTVRQRLGVGQGAVVAIAAAGDADGGVA